MDILIESDKNQPTITMLGNIKHISELEGDRIFDPCLDIRSNDFSTVRMDRNGNLSPDIINSIRRYDQLAEAVYAFAVQDFPIYKKNVLADYTRNYSQLSGFIVNVASVKKALMQIYKMDNFSRVDQSWIMTVALAIAGSLDGEILQHGTFNYRSSLLAKYNDKRILKTAEIIRETTIKTFDSFLSRGDVRGQYRFDVVRYWESRIVDYTNRKAAKEAAIRISEKMDKRLGKGKLIPLKFGYIDVLIYSVAFSWYYRNRIGNSNPFLDVEDWPRLIAELKSKVLHYTDDIVSVSTREGFLPLAVLFDPDNTKTFKLKDLKYYVDQCYVRGYDLTEAQLYRFYANYKGKLRMRQRDFGLSDLCFIIYKINRSTRLSKASGEMTKEAQEYFNNVVEILLEKQLK